MSTDPEHDCILLVLQFWRMARSEWNDEYIPIGEVLSSMIDARLKHGSVVYLPQHIEV